MPEFVIVIPARYESQRLPGKALLDIGGKPLVQHTWERARESGAKKVVIATDDPRIEQAACAFGAEAVMTSREHESGSDRIAECADLLGWGDMQLIVNLQGDEPLMPPECLQQVADLLDRNPGADAASLYWPIVDEYEVEDPDTVKVVCDQSGRALMFSRSVLPHARGFESTAAALKHGIRWNRHLGLYAYRADSLRRFTKTRPTPLERAERLEQLRYLETGGSIVLEQARSHIPAGVDNSEDLERVRSLIE
jgi:3-deoxy-manno-octulosonate cytidylyltransferase (CMP-KDO synthetase)